MNASQSSVEAKMQRLQEDNEALRASSLMYAAIAERLAERVRELERRLGQRRS